MTENSKISSQCIGCLLNKYLNKFPKTASEEEKLNYMKGVLNIMASCGNDISAPEIVGLITEYKTKLFGFSDDFSDVKKYFNKLMLNKQDYFSNNIDSLQTALKFAMLGNYIDFGALDNVDESKLLKIPEDSQKLNIDNREFENFLKELKKAQNLVYLTDNCGEIVMDKLFIKEIKKHFPKLNITVIVKGGPVLNDATIEDAKEIGLLEVATVIHNGCSIAGTPLRKISAQATELIDNADLIIAKGQANFETLIGCKKNIYYIFLCKCSLYSTRFNVPQFTGLFLNEKRM